MLNKYPSWLTLTLCCICSGFILICFVAPDFILQKLTYSSEKTNYEAFSALFSGMAFVAVFYTLHQQQKAIEISNRQHQEALVAQEKNEILQAISSVRNSLSELNQLYQKKDTSNDRRSIQQPHFSDCIYEELQEQFRDFQDAYNLAKTEDERIFIKEKTAYVFGYITQPFLQIAGQIRCIYSRIDNSPILSEQDKKWLAAQSFCILHHVDVKLLNIIFAESIFRDDLAEDNRQFEKDFDYSAGKKVVSLLGMGSSPETEEAYYDIIHNSYNLQENFERKHQKVFNMMTSNKPSFEISANSKDSEISFAFYTYRNR